ncbi:non-ribosomal peptide synthetase [Arenibacter lacus]|uniref:non-ribosomal peptide synthetase n=1 Tax=Arenibacter lacus TaxID=2608629 RepID=UPI00123D2183|nr:amino acid adenylation domain-containing protein [Arenibacter lacus]
MSNPIDKKSLLSRWKEHSLKDASIVPISKAPDGIDVPLSRGQERLWVLQQLHPSNPFYNYCELYRFKGELHSGFLLQSMQAVFLNNSIFRTTFYMKGAITYQKPHDSEIKINYKDLSPLEEKEKERAKEKIIDTVAKSSFDLATFPLTICWLLKLSDVEHLLILNMHHIITDKWSMGVFRKELIGHYQKLRAGIAIPVDKELQYSDYAYWQSKQTIDENQLSYWEEQLKGQIPTLDLPLDYPRKMTPSFKGGLVSNKLDHDLSSAILTLAKQWNTTPYVLLLSVFKLLLYKYSGQEDILIGSPISKRNEKSVENLIGFFNETVVLRSRLSPQMTFLELVESIRETTLEAFNNKDVPFELLVKKLKPERSLNLHPFFQVMFLFHSVPSPLPLDSNCTMEYAVLDLDIAKFDLTLYVEEDNGKLSTTFEYAKDLFKESTIQRMQQYFQLLLEKVVGFPSLPIGKGSLLTRLEKKLVTDAKPRMEYSYHGIHELISIEAGINPNSIAVVYEDERISYGELNEKSTILANNLQEYSRGENLFVGLCVERSVDMIVGILGILKAGCAYLPLDPGYPMERIDYMLKDAKIKVLLTSKNLKPKFNKEALITLTIAKLCTSNSKKEIALPIARESNFAYLIYTSGSSGTPKGVAITHKNIISATISRITYYKNAPTSFLLMSSIAFDSSKAGIFWTLCTGGQLVVTRKGLEQEVDLLYKTLSEHQVSHTLMLPSVYKLVLDNLANWKFPKLNTVIVAGEECSRAVGCLHLSKLPQVELHNEYGPTEATVWCTVHRINSAEEHGKVPIGRPIENSEILLLDDHLNHVPFGAKGEIYIGGAGVANGYLNRDEASEEAFIAHPFKMDAPYKLYKTGDIGRYRFDGNLEFLGRKDTQIKIRGHRVSLHEIESLIRTTDCVYEVMVKLESTGGELQEVAVADFSVEELLAFMDKYMEEAQIKEIISSVTSLRKEELNYLLEQIKDK